MTQTIETDGELGEQELTLETALELREAGPWGQGFPAPVFRGEVDLVSQRVVGESHLKMALGGGGCLYDAIAFRQEPLGDARRVELVYKLGVNTYGGGQTLQLMVEYVRPTP